VENLWTRVLKIDNSKLICSYSRSCQLFKIELDLNQRAGNYIFIILVFVPKGTAVYYPHETNELKGEWSLFVQWHSQEMQNDDNKGNEEITRRNIRKTTNRLNNVSLLPRIPSKKLRLLGYSDKRLRPISETFGTKTTAIAMNVPTWNSLSVQKRAWEALGSVKDRKASGAGGTRSRHHQVQSKRTGEASPWRCLQKRIPMEPKWISLNRLGMQFI